MWVQIFGISALTHTARLTNSLARSLTRMVTKLQWLYWRIHDNWVAYFRIWSRRSLHRFCGRAQTYWSQSDVFNSPKPCYVTPTSETKKPSLGVICPGDPQQRNPNATKFDYRSQEETKWQERCAREAAWKKARCILKVKEKLKTTFFSPSENWCLPSPSTIKPEERICCGLWCVDAHDQQKGLELRLNWKPLRHQEVLRQSQQPMEKWQTNEEATVSVKELDIFLTMKLLEDTPGVISLGKLSDEQGYSYEWINGQKPHLTQNGVRIQSNTENFVPVVAPGLCATPSSSSTSTSTIPSRQDIDHSDHHPAIESSESVDRQARGDPFTSATSEELSHEPTKIPKPN